MPQSPCRTIRRLRFVGDYLRSPRSRFDYRRDERDQKFLELAISLRATHILSADKDLLFLPEGQSEASKRLPATLTWRGSDGGGEVPSPAWGTDRYFLRSSLHQSRSESRSTTSCRLGWCGLSHPFFCQSLQLIVVSDQIHSVPIAMPSSSDTAETMLNSRFRIT